MRAGIVIEESLTEAYNATKKTAPNYQFGTSIRPKLNETVETPGPGEYKIKTTVLGRTADSQIRSTPQFSLRSREKFGNPMLRAVDGELARQPGPGYYAPKQVNNIPPKYSFPKGKARPSSEASGEHLAPGPGQYSIPSSVGKQILSNKKTIPLCGFGNGERPALLKEQSELGPGEYGSGVPACSKQLDSRKRTAGYVKFSQAQRDPQASVSALDEIQSRPGPGTYKLKSALAGQGAAYPFKAAPKCSLSGRQKFGSPFAKSW